MPGRQKREERAAARGARGAAKVWVVALKLRFAVPGAHSLKDKRRVVKSIREKLANDYPVAVAETGHQDAWDRAEIGIAAVGGDRRFLNTMLDDILNRLRRHPEAILAGEERESFGF
ncbi:MAG: DUF503 domain-containing protein [Planctomycetota bacterium]|nr:DUF503 domain-containing protein [Planctomycetota bacterium]